MGLKILVNFAEDFISGWFRSCVEAEAA